MDDSATDNVWILIDVPHPLQYKHWRAFAYCHLAVVCTRLSPFLGKWKLHPFFRKGWKEKKEKQFKVVIAGKFYFCCDILGIYNALFRMSSDRSVPRNLLSGSSKLYCYMKSQACAEKQKRSKITFLKQSLGRSTRVAGQKTTSVTSTIAVKLYFQHRSITVRIGKQNTCHFLLNLACWRKIWSVASAKVFTHLYSRFYFFMIS